MLRALAASIILMSTPALAATPSVKPNIVLMMSDDQGWMETGYNGHPYLKTPVLDEMAALGLRLDRFYAASPVCSPTRASVMTGRHANRSGCFGAGWSIRPEEVTLGKLMKDAGYRTAHFGKWHVGAIKEGSPLSPKALGFDENLSHDNFFEINPELSRNGLPAQRIEGESSEILVGEALAFAHKANGEGKPFFIIVWFGSPHSPYVASKEDSAPYAELGSELSQRLGELAAMDRAIGTFREGLDAMGERPDTLLWFNSDNGITQEDIPKAQLKDLYKNAKISGHKSQMQEGGLRVPGIIEWPSVISSPRTSSVPCVTSDILPTLLDIIGLEHPRPERPLDGISLKELLVHGTMNERPSPIGFWGYANKSLDLQNKPWLADASLNEEITMTTKQKDRAKKGRSRKYYFKNYQHPSVCSNLAGPAAWIDGCYKLLKDRQGKKYSLYDLERDPGEKHDIAPEHPEKAKAMRKQLEAWQLSVEKSLTGADY